MSQNTSNTSTAVPKAARYAQIAKRVAEERKSSEGDREAEFLERLEAASNMFIDDFKAEIEEFADNMAHRGRDADTLYLSWRMDKKFKNTSFNVSSLVYGFIRPDDRKGRNRYRRQSEREERDPEWDKAQFSYKLNMQGTPFEVAQAELAMDGFIVTNKSDIRRGNLLVVRVEFADLPEVDVQGTETDENPNSYASKCKNGNGKA